MKVIIIGGRGNGTVIASTIVDVMKVSRKWELLGYLNDDGEIDSLIEDYPVLGRVADARNFNQSDVYYIYALATVKKEQERVEILKLLNLPREKFATVIHPTAIVAHSAKIGYGVVLMPYVVIGPGVVIGDHAQIYAQGFVGHDTKIGDFCFIANNASVGGSVLLKEGVHVGSNSSILEHVTLGEWSIAGLGAVVIKDVEPGTIVVGNPAKVKNVIS